MRVYTAHRGWLGAVIGISAASIGGVLVFITCTGTYNVHVNTEDVTMLQCHCSLCGQVEEILLLNKFFQLSIRA